MEKCTVINRLIAWSKWKLLSGNALGFPKSSSFTHLVVDNSRRNESVEEIDSWCIETNKAIEELPGFHLLIIRVEYLSNVREMPLKLELIGIKSKKTYYEYLNAAYEKIAVNIEKEYVDSRETISV